MCRKKFQVYVETGLRIMCTNKFEVYLGTSFEVYVGTSLRFMLERFEVYV